MQLFSADHIAEIPRKVVEMANLFFSEMSKDFKMFLWEMCMVA